jgi:hypothetical protein
MASFGPALRSRLFAIRDVALLRLWLQKDCGLVLNRNLLFMDGHLGKNKTNGMNEHSVDEKANGMNGH